jgi:hypothetical protein
LIKRIGFVYDPHYSTSLKIQAHLEIYENDLVTSLIELISQNLPF